MACKRVIFLPIWRDGHFILLELVRKGESWDLLYYETLNIQKASCRHSAQCLLKNVFHISDELPQRVNKDRQVAAECGFHVCHRIEERIRFHCGQGAGSVGWPDQARIRALRKELNNLTKVMKATRAKWRVEIEREEEQEVEQSGKDLALAKAKANLKSRKEEF